MNKKIILYLLFSLFNAPLFGEGFTSNTLVATFPGSLQHMNRIIAGFNTYSLNQKGEVVFSRINKRETTEVWAYLELTIEGGTKIHADYDQLFYCPNRDTWVKLVELDEDKDSVYSLIKGPLRVLGIRRIRTAFFSALQQQNLKAEIHRISVEHGNYFVSKDFILVHNFEPITLSIGAMIALYGPEILATAAVCLAKIYLAEKANESLTPHITTILKGGNPFETQGTPAAPNIQTPKTENVPKGTQPENEEPPQKGGPDISKLIPAVPAVEEARKKGFFTTIGDGVKAVGQGIKNAATSTKNFFTGKAGGGNPPTPTTNTNPQLIIDKLSSNSLAGQQSKHTTQFVRLGDSAKATAEFKSFNPAEVQVSTTSKGSLTIGKLIDGRTINVRTFSTGNAPTLEIYDSITKHSIKYRYVDDLGQATKFQ